MTLENITGLMTLSSSQTNCSSRLCFYLFTTWMTEIHRQTTDWTAAPICRTWVQMYVIQMEQMYIAFRQMAEGENQYTALLLSLLYGRIVKFKGLIYLHSVTRILSLYSMKQLSNKRQCPCKTLKYSYTKKVKLKNLYWIAFVSPSLFTYIHIVLIFILGSCGDIRTFTLSQQ